jgi:hypothetical protein
MGGGEVLDSRQFADHRVELVLGDAVAKLEAPGDQWQFAVLVRDGDQVRVHVHGTRSPVIITMPAAPLNSRLRFGAGLQGKLDEIAVFNRVLTPAEIAAFWDAAEIGAERGTQIR